MDLKSYFKRQYHLDSSVHINKYNAFIRRYYRLINKFYTNDFLQIFWANPNDGIEIPTHTLSVSIYGKRNIFYIRTMLSKEIGENGKITDPGIRYFYIKNKKKICKINDDNFVGYRVLKDIEVSSPSKAAWLIRGYKCNGPDCWKNSRGETLRQYLKFFQKAYFKRILSRSASDVPKDQEEHPAPLEKRQRSKRHPDRQ